MSMKKSIIAAVAATIAMGVFAVPASAKFAAATATDVASDTLATTKATGVFTGANLAFTSVVGDLVLVGQPDTLTLTLTSGAKWKTAPKLATAATNGWTLNGVAAGTVAAGVVDATGTIATWSVAVAGTGLATGANALTFTTTTADGKIDLSGVTADVDAIMETKVGGISFGTAKVTKGAATTPLITITDSFKKSSAAALTATADVTTIFTKFKTGAGITLTKATTELVLANEVVGTPNAAASLLVTLTGNFAGIKSVTGISSGANITSLTASNASGVTTAVTGTNIGNAGAWYIDTAANKAYAVVVVAAATSSTGANNIAPTFELDGTSTQSARTFTATADLMVDANYAARTGILAGVSGLTIGRDGASFSINSTGSLNNIKITDTSGSVAGTGAAISVAAFDAAGATVTAVAGAPAIASTVAANATVVVTGAELLALYPTAIRFDFTVDSSNLVVSNVKKNTVANGGGITVTTYRSGANSGGTL